MGGLIRGLVEGFGSKKVMLAVASVVVFLMGLLLKAIGPKYGIVVDPADLQTFAMVIASVVVPVVLALWHIDVSTDGKTTTAALLAQKAAGEVQLAMADKAAVLGMKSPVTSVTGPQ